MNCVAKNFLATRKRSTLFLEERHENYLHYRDAKQTNNHYELKNGNELHSIAEITLSLRMTVPVQRNRNQRTEMQTSC
jgi:prenyltransferase beta subunit